MTAKGKKKGNPLNGIWGRFFDKVYVLSLPDSRARRNRIGPYLADFGILDFEFHDAFGKDSKEVRSAYDSGIVKTFPPCFRCGKVQCDIPDCNNVLVPSQVGNFLSLLALWTKIAATPQRALVLEDDVVFHPWTMSNLKWLSTQELGMKRLQSIENPWLLRLGWGLSKNHTEMPPRISRQIKMSNPCYGVNSAMAARLLKRFKKIDTTSDIFLHRQAPHHTEAFTLFPPLASDLSWSTGTVPSEIHPKTDHVDFLNGQGRKDDAANYQTVVDDHESHRFWRRILVLGHPRGGTGYAAFAMRQWNVDIGHECDGRKGLSSWMLAVEDEAPWSTAPIARNRKNLSVGLVVQVVRNPFDAIPSIIRENKHAPISFEFRRKHILAKLGIDIAAYETDIDKAAMSLIGWTKIIRDQQPDLWFRLEDGLEKLKAFLTEQKVQHKRNGSLDFPRFNAEKRYKGVRYSKPQLSPEDWSGLSPDCRIGLLEYCEIYGYDGSTILKSDDTVQ